MRYKKSSIFVAALLCAMLLSACAGTARGLKQSVYQNDDTLQVIDDGRSEADAMVVIRYPAMVQEDAQAAYYRKFEQHAIGGSVDREKSQPAQVDRVAQSVITKSNFYAMSLYGELRARLPEGAVLLSPHVIELDGNQRLTSRALLAAEQVPSVVTIDFSIYSFPDPGEMMNAPPLTFGDIVTPLFVIHANRWARPSTHGLLLASDALVDSAWLLSGEQATAQVDALRDRQPPPPRPLDFVHFLDRGNPAFRDLPLKSPGESRHEVVAVEVHPLEKIRMDPDLMERMRREPDLDPFAEEFVKGAATRIVTALNIADHDRATFFERQAALAAFDPDLGIAFLSRSGSEALRARRQMGESLLRAERAFLSAQAAALYEGARDGVFGDQMRQMIMAEYDMLEERRELAVRQNWSTAIAILAMAGAAYAGSDLDSSNFFHSSTFGNLAMLGSVWAMNTAFSSNAQSKIVGENFLVQMAPAMSRQITVQLEWLDSTEEITARDFSEFRARTLALYQSRVRGLDAGHDRRCAFVHPALDATGNWFGPCQDGRAEGGGYGVVVDSAGNTVEYLGAAAGGLAEGTGAMIFRAPGGEGAVYYEGDFDAGQPHGVVRVEQAGRKPRLREFVEGRDSGAADIGQWRSLDF